MVEGRRAERSQRRRATLGALLWLLCVQFFVAEQIARLGCATYSMRLDVISDLGAVHCGAAAAAGHVVCSPLHALMNGSFILQGLLIFFGAVLVRKVFPSTGQYTLALGLLALAGVGVLVVGLAPEDVHPAAHISGAAANFLAGGAGMCVLGVARLRELRARRTAGWLTLLAGAICLLATGLLGFRGTWLWAAAGLHIGTIERFAAYPLPLWLTGTGAQLLARRKAGAGSPAGS